MTDREALADTAWNRYHSAGSSLDMLLHVAHRGRPQDARQHAENAREELEAVIESLKEIEAAEAEI